MEFEWSYVKELWELLKTRRYRRLVPALAFPVLLAVFLAYTPDRYETYLVGAGLVLFGLQTTLKGRTFVGCKGRERPVEDPFVRVLGLLTSMIGVTVLVYAL